MAEEERQNMIGEEHNRDDDQNENLETVFTRTVSANPDQDASVSSETTDHSMLPYTTGGTEVQPSDVSILKESNQKSLGCQSSGKSPECTVFREFATNNENENVSHVSPISVERMNKFSFHESPERSDHNKSLSPLQKTEDKSIEMSEKRNLSVTSVSEITWEMQQKSETVPPSTIKNKRFREESSPCIPLIKLPLQNDDVIKCPDYASDEFADIEDNVKDSSSSNESKCNVEKSLSLEFQPRERESGLIFGNTIVNRNSYFISSDFDSGTTSSSSSSNSKTNSSNYSSSSNSEHNDLADKVTQEKFPSTSKKRGELFDNNSAKKHCEPITTKPAGKSSNGTKKKFESSMETIPEVSESENDGETSYPSSSIFEILRSEHREQISEKKQTSNKLKIRPKVVKRSDRCHVCNAKLGLCGIKCRCGGYYCAKHRYDREHDCPFDYKSLGEDEIRRNNPKITAEKVRKL